MSRPVSFMPGFIWYRTYLLQKILNLVIQGFRKYTDVNVTLLEQI
jgi:hypothetical protein